MMRRLTTSNLMSQEFKFMPLTGIWKEMLGDMERSGCWLIYGDAKNGKSSFALQLARYLSTLEKVLYISAEEGTGYTYTWKLAKAGFTSADRSFYSWPYIPIEDLRTELATNRKAEKIVFIDNVTVYRNELDGTVVHEMLTQFPRTLFIFIAHEENGRPQYQAGDQCHKYANVIFHIKGLAADVTVRTGGEGGVYVVDPVKAALVRGDKINRTSSIV